MNHADVRFQVFVSSTFTDLKEERAEVMHCLLELDCIPAGMELFPAANDAAWELIKRVIDQSDYYLLIIGGRYGSLDISGISFTEREYDYALSANKQILAFLHEHPDNIPVGKSEISPDARTKLERFSEKVRAAHLCKFWEGSDDLGGKVSRALSATIRSRPSVGWIRADRAQTVEDLKRINDLQRQTAELLQENQLLKQQLVDLTRAVPKSHSESVGLSAFCRQIDIAWDIESSTSIRDPKAVAEILERIREKLLQFAQELSEVEHFQVFYELKEIARQVNETIRSNPFESVTDKTNAQWFQEASDAIETFQRFARACLNRVPQAV